MRKYLSLILIPFIFVSIAFADVSKGLIGKEDFKIWDGKTSTFTRSSSSGRHLTLHKIDWSGVDILQVYGGGTNRTDATITDAMNSVGSTADVSFFLSNGTWTISNDLTVASNVTLVAPPGTILSVDSGKTITINGTLKAGAGSIAGAGTIVISGSVFAEKDSFDITTATINGSFNAGLYKVFSSGTTATFGYGDTIREVYPQWWGALGDNSQDDTSYFNSAAASITYGVVRVPAGIYVLNSKTAYTSANTSGTLYGQIILNNNVSLKGDGLSSQLKCTLDDTFYATVVVNGTNHSIIEGLYILGTGTAYSTNYGGGIRVELSGKTVVRDNYIKDTRGIAINFVGNSGGNTGSTGVDYYCAYTHTYNNTIEDCNGDGIYHIFSKYATIDHNTLDNTGYTDSIILEACDHSTVDNNILIYPQYRGILSNTGSNYVTISNNTIYMYDATTLYEAIYLSSVQYNNVTGNIIRFSTSGGAAQSAIETIPGSYGTNSTYHNISGNQIHNAGGTTTTAAIHITTDYNTISNNKINGGVYGIGLDGADYTVVMNNSTIGMSGEDLRIVGDESDAPTYTQVIGNYFGNDTVNDQGTSTFYSGNAPHSDTVIADGNFYNNSQVDLYKSVLVIDSSSTGVDITLKDHTVIGHILTIIMSEASNSSTVSVEHHVTSDPEIGTFDAVDEVWVLQWTGTEYQTIGTPTCTF